METFTTPSPSLSRPLCSTQSKCRAVLAPRRPLSPAAPHRHSADRIPKVSISSDDEGAKEIELSDDPYDCMRIDVENVPCMVTLCKVSGFFHTRPKARRQHARFHAIWPLRRWATATSLMRLCRRRRAPWRASSCPSHTGAWSPAHARWGGAAWTRRASSK